MQPRRTFASFALGNLGCSYHVVQLQHGLSEHDKGHRRGDRFDLSI